MKKNESSCQVWPYLFCIRRHIIFSLKWNLEKEVVYKLLKLHKSVSEVWLDKSTAVSFQTCDMRSCLCFFELMDECWRQLTGFYSKIIYLIRTKEKRIKYQASKGALERHTQYQCICFIFWCCYLWWSMTN